MQAEYDIVSLVLEHGAERVSRMFARCDSPPRKRQRTTATATPKKRPVGKRAKPASTAFKYDRMVPESYDIYCEGVHAACAQARGGKLAVTRSGLPDDLLEAARSTLVDGGTPLDEHVVRLLMHESIAAVARELFGDGGYLIDTGRASNFAAKPSPVVHLQPARVPSSPNVLLVLGDVVGGPFGGGPGFAVGVNMESTSGCASVVRGGDVMSHMYFPPLYAGSLVFFPATMPYVLMYANAVGPASEYAIQHFQRSPHLDPVTMKPLGPEMVSDEPTAQATLGLCIAPQSMYGVVHRASLGKDRAPLLQQVASAIPGAAEFLALQPRTGGKPRARKRTASADFCPSPRFSDEH